MAKKSSSSKKSNSRRFATIGLWIAGIALLAGGLLLVVKLMAVMGLFTISNAKWFNLALWICLALLIIGPAVFSILDPGRVRELIAGRQAKYGSNALILLIAFIAILFVVNIIVYQNPLQGDWTEDKQHTLAPETLSTLKALPKPVRAIAFYTTSSSRTDAEQLLTDFKSNSAGKFNYQFVDPNADPVEAQQYQVTRDATIVLVMGNNKEMVTTITEQELTNAFVRLMNPGNRTVYFLTGHGEHDLSTSSQTSYTRVQTVLQAKNYTVRTLNLRAQNQVPADAKAIVIAGPSLPVSAEEVALLNDYLSHGGALVVMEEPTFLMDPKMTSDPLADYLAATWGITLNNDLVIDPNQNPVVLVVADTQNYGSHPITDKLQGKTTFFPTARSLTIATVANVQTTSLVNTISRAWGETDIEALKNNQLVFDATKDLAGPLSIAAATTNTSNQGRVVVIGDSDFANDSYFDQYANSDMIINSVDWAAGQENMINLTAKQPISRQLVLPNSVVMVVLDISLCLILPGLVLAGGIVSWLMRRARG